MFSKSHLPYEADKIAGTVTEKVPNLKELARAAIKVLERPSNQNGFLLLVESGRIDHAHHENYVQRAMEETLMLDDSVSVTDPPGHGRIRGIIFIHGVRPYKRTRYNANIRAL